MKIPLLPTLAVLALGCLALAPPAQARTVHYELTATQSPVNLSGAKTVDFALRVNGGIPAPTLEFTEGDEAEIVVRNRIPEQELSIHWHGILLPNEMDGVPYVTTPPILSGQDFTFRFRIRQHGTYWYHSHTKLQEQKGVYGAIVIHPKKERLAYDKDVVAVLSDWSDENPDSILKNLKKDGEYYRYKKNTVRSWWGAIQAGSLGTFLHNEWTRMGGMDLSDVGYDAFLINGRRDSQLITAHPGEKVRIRIINASSSTYFYVSLAGGPMKVVSVDGVDVAPAWTNEILTGMAEVHDILFEVPEHKNYELRVTSQDGTGTASAWIGMGEQRVTVPVRAAPDLGEHTGHAVHAGHAEHSGHAGTSPEKPAEGSVIPTLTVDDVQAMEPTEFPGKARVHDLKLVLGGDMGRYVWHINKKAIHEERSIEVREGDVVRFTFENQTMMHHPMHLHGHFFRVLNSFGARSPLKHTVDVPPHGTRTIEFLANEPGEWMLHCHNLYHLKSGMARVVKYLSYAPKPEMAHYQKHDPHAHEHGYFYGSSELATNHARTYLRASQTRNQLEARLEARNTAGKSFSLGEPWDAEGDLFYRRWIDSYTSLIAGAVSFGGRGAGVLGVGVLLPMLIESQLLIDHRGHFRLDLEKRFQWTSRVFTDVDFTWRPAQVEKAGHAAEFEISLMYAPAWSWAAGLMLTDDSFGAGVQLRY